MFLYIIIYSGWIKLFSCVVHICWVIYLSFIHPILFSQSIRSGNLINILFTVLILSYLRMLKQTKGDRKPHETVGQQPLD